MLNGKVGKMAIVVKSNIPNSPNLGKIVTPLRLATPDDIQKIGYIGGGILWNIDTEISWLYLDGTLKKQPFVQDKYIRTLPDLDEDEYTIQEKEIETNKN